jgi:hypothetical protein
LCPEPSGNYHPSKVFVAADDPPKNPSNSTWVLEALES